MRIDKAIKNSYFAIWAQAVNVILKAATQVVFVRTLSIEYVGVNGLFSNILTMLSLAELGVGSAILYNMYRPIAQHDVHRIKSLMNFYKETYYRIGTFVLIVGMALTPFLKYLIKEQPDIPELNLIYVLYVINNAVSYFFVYKQSILIADQKNYIIMKSNIIKNIVMNVLQILLLLTTRIFMPYLIISIATTILFNFVNSRIADKNYPYLQDNKEKLDKVEKRQIYKDVYAMMAHKVGGVIVLGTDNLLLSAFVGVTAVGLYSNYVLILSSVKGFFSQVYEALVSIIGDLINTEADEKIYVVYKNILFICFWLTSLVSIGFYCLVNPVVAIVFGQDYVLSQDIVALMTINFYITDLVGMRAVTNKFKTAMGLFWKDRYKPYVEAAINLIASIYFLRKMGFAGILLGTLISTLTTGFWIEPFVLYRYGFKKKLIEYYKIYLLDIAIFCVSLTVTSFIISMIDGGLVGLLLKAVVCIVIPSVLIYAIYRNSVEYQYFMVLVNRVKNKVVNRK